MNKDRLQSNLRSARKHAKLTQSAIGKAVGVTPQYVWQWENGVRTPKLKTIERIAATCGIHPNEILDGVLEKEESR